MKIIDCYSPNFDKKKRSFKTIKIIVIHYTGMQSERESLIRLCKPTSKVSSHFLINKNGKVYRLVKDNKIAWHAGKSFWGKYKNLNKNSIGIELVNKGHKFGYTNFKKKQLLSLISISKKIIKKYKIKKKYIVGHSDIAPLRKIDPGEKFPWEFLAKKNIGNWHNVKPYVLKKFRKIKISKNIDEKIFFNNLKKIGYYFSVKKKPIITKIVKAFQRHYRKELVNGIVDKECFIIAENLLKKL
ncbi:N-acetylmuramoyl-L-alanine amidase [Pelagibacteraceae bacterium]|nr:N-acetylmuramoyl-L-alanine amidase [Pelagibacteraceae bacterium]